MSSVSSGCSSSTSDSGCSGSGTCSGCSGSGKVEDIDESRNKDGTRETV